MLTFDFWVGVPKKCRDGMGCKHFLQRREIERARQSGEGEGLGNPKIPIHENV